MEASEVISIVQNAMKTTVELVAKATTDLAVQTERLNNAIAERRMWQTDMKREHEEIFERLRLAEGNIRVLNEKEEGALGPAHPTEIRNGLNPQRIMWDLVKLILTTLFAIVVAFKLTGKL